MKKTKIYISKINHPCYKDPEFGNKISKSLKGRKAEWNFKSINQYSLNGEFIKEWINQKEAENTLNYKKGSISACCNKRQKTAYGYVWKFNNN
jgi:hypothetical protein